MSTTPHNETSPMAGPAGGSPDATALVEEHLPLVNHVVFQVAVHFPRHVDRNDLINAGAIGLVEAARRFDESRGVPFNRFAAQRIRGAIIDAVRAADWAPRSVRTLARRLDTVEQRLAANLGRLPSIGETAIELGVSTEEVQALREKVFRSVVLAFEHVAGDSPDEELTLIDVLADDGREPDAELEDRELKAYLREAVAHLPERHRLIVVGYFIQERTSEDLARFLGVTESRISQMRTEALGMLKRGIEAQYTQRVEEPRGLVERRRADYARRIAESSDVTERIGLRSEPDSDHAFCDEIDRLVDLAAT